jgi:SMODS-associating 2TM, beta-strand rich effector domain
MIGKVTLQYIAGAVVIVFALGIWITGGEVKLGWLKFYAAAVLIAGAGLLLWEHILWRIPPVQRIPKVPRLIRGTWRVALASYWRDPKTGAGIPPKDVYAVVRQTASRLSVTLHSDESSSTSTFAKLSRLDGSWTLDYMYLNQPALSVEERSRIHHGSASLNLSGFPVSRLKGRYWTDRDSKGELDFTERQKSLVDDYESARRLWP